MTDSPTPSGLHPLAAQLIPTLNQDMAMVDVPPAVTLALDARLAEKQALMALSEELEQNLRPEIERLTKDMVQRTLQGVWDKRARLDLEN